MRRMHHFIVVAAACCGAVVRAGPGAAQGPQADQLSPDLQRVFAAELDAPLPSHVLGIAIYEAEVTGVSTTPYCPMRTALCGENPTCGHPKQAMTKMELKAVKRLRFKPQDGTSPLDVKLPADLTYRKFGQEQAMATGEKVAAAVFYYRNSVPPQVAKLHKLP